MKKNELKKKILEAAVVKQESIVDDFRLRIKDIIANEGNVNEEEYDNHQQSFKSEGITEVNLLKDELEFATSELEEIRKIQSFEESSHLAVEYGTVVRTNRRTFLVSASIENFEVEGIKLFGLSVNAPLYKQMKGRKKGESFMYGNTSYVIEDIF